MVTRMAQQHVSVPEHIVFADLNLHRKSDGKVYFDWAPIHEVCQASGVDADALDYANVTRLILAWYQAHRRSGGAPDATIEDLMSEVTIERRCGSFSHPPGHA
jgi:hypothetical protein